MHVRDGRQRFRAARRVRVGGSPGVGGGTGPAEHAKGSGAGGAAAFPWCGLRRAEPCVPVLGSALEQVGVVSAVNVPAIAGTSWLSLRLLLSFPLLLLLGLAKPESRSDDHGEEDRCSPPVLSPNCSPQTVLSSCSL